MCYWGSLLQAEFVKWKKEPLAPFQKLATWVGGLSHMIQQNPWHGQDQLQRAATVMAMLFTKLPLGTGEKFVKRLLETQHTITKCNQPMFHCVGQLHDWMLSVSNRTDNVSSSDNVNWKSHFLASVRHIWMSGSAGKIKTRMRNWRCDCFREIWTNLLNSCFFFCFFFFFFKKCENKTRGSSVSGSLLVCGFVWRQLSLTTCCAVFKYPLKIHDQNGSEHKSLVWGRLTRCNNESFCRDAKLSLFAFHSFRQRNIIKTGPGHQIGYAWSSNWFWLLLETFRQCWLQNATELILAPRNRPVSTETQR